MLVDYRPLAPRFHRLLNFLAGAAWCWVVWRYALGGWEGARYLLTAAGWLPWLLLALVLFLVLARSDYRQDIPLFLAGLALGYWGEWWGTTRGVWTYWNGAQPPDYLPPLWGLGLLTVYRLAGWLRPLFERPWSRPVTLLLALLPFLLVPLSLALSWPRLAAVDWRGRLDLHFCLGLLVAALLLAWRFEARRLFPLFLCGALLGGLYETLGTTSHEWTYVTGEISPLWIVPLWGLASVAMVNLAELFRLGLAWLWRRLYRRRPCPQPSQPPLEAG